MNNLSRIYLLLLVHAIIYNMQSTWTKIRRTIQFMPHIFASEWKKIHILHVKWYLILRSSQNMYKSTENKI